MIEARKVALITGAGSGLGRATAHELARSGIAIVAIGRRAEPLHALAAELKDVVPVSALPLDITASGAPKDAIAHAVERFGRLDYLINNAGPGYPKPLSETTDEDIDRFIGAHLRAPARFIREAGTVMTPGSGIVNISSCLALRGRAGVGIYAAAKAGLIGLTMQIAAEFAERGIRSNCIAPGVIMTDLATGRMGDARFQRLMIETIPSSVRKTGRPEEIGAMVAFLCSKHAEFINGQTLVVDGGWSSTHYLSPEALGR